ncbi:MAG: hypothetical protein P1U42_10790 [Phycisphaerales bacterium]|nr:hypothetical protein [Phycisphaerales bacterium]
MSTELSNTKQSIYKKIELGATDSGVFSEVSLTNDGLSCKALNSAEPAFYWVRVLDNDVWISLETEDRWLSGSIEEDLVNTGDKIDELIEEEVIDLGDDGAKVSIEHFRSPEKIYVFRSKLSTQIDDPAVTDRALIWLKGYELVFRELGDMDESDED